MGFWTDLRGTTESLFKFASKVGLGADAGSNQILVVGTPATGNANMSVIWAASIGQSDVTGTLRYFRTGVGTAAASFTLGALSHFHAAQGTFGAGSAVTTQYGFIVDSTLTGATNNYAFHHNLAASGTSRYGFYGAGTAPNYLNGCTGVGVVPTTTSALTLAASVAGVSSLNVPHGTAPSSPVNGDVWSTTTGFAFRINGATATLSGVNTGDQTNISGNAATVTTNANLTGPITSSGNATAIASQTGTGTKFVMDTSPTLVTPTIGVATATSVNKMAITAPATSSTLAVADGKTFTASNSLTLAGTDSTTMTFPAASDTVAGLGTVQTFTKAQRGAFNTLTDASTVALDLSLANVYNLVLGGNRTLGAPSSVGFQQGFINVYQDTTGSRTLAYAWFWGWAGGVAGVLSTAGCTRDSLTYKIDQYNTGTVTMTIATPGVATLTAHGLISGAKCQMTTTGALPTGLSANTTYWIHVIDANTFHFCTSLANVAAGTYIATSGSQSGTHTIVAGGGTLFLNKAES